MAWKSNASPSCKRRVMVVADATAESVAALQYVLSHAMQDNDDLILMHVTQPTKKSHLLIKSFFRRHSDPGLAGISNFDPTADVGEGGGGSGGKDFLEVMKRACKGTFPNSRVWVEKVEQGSLDNKGAVILLRCKELMVDLLVVGQRRHLVSVLLGPRRSFSTGSTVLRGGAPKSVDMVEYLIENSPCTCVAVQKKGQNSGYILNSKTHRNFWLLV
ncbi:uncharacterized protein LOC110719568 [Chenopodium quinoa]|uniref:uncharacterized protein LOC110719568 n=1 Tax=Chenopodium quinoa TaxID=63459 RepID=UPI000B78C581|nr:uncharacterized protein LOC110719568 [Chenopodium quinoa]